MEMSPLSVCSLGLSEQVEGIQRDSSTKLTKHCVIRPGSASQSFFLRLPAPCEAPQGGNICRSKTWTTCWCTLLLHQDVRRARPDASSPPLVSHSRATDPNQNLVLVHSHQNDSTFIVIPLGFGDVIIDRGSALGRTGDHLGVKLHKHPTNPHPNPTKSFFPTFISACW